MNFIVKGNRHRPVIRTTVVYEGPEYEELRAELEKRAAEQFMKSWSCVQPFDSKPKLVMIRHCVVPRDGSDLDGLAEAMDSLRHDEWHVSYRWDWPGKWILTSSAPVDGTLAPCQ